MIPSGEHMSRVDRAVDELQRERKDKIQQLGKACLHTGITKPTTISKMIKLLENFVYYSVDKLDNNEWKCWQCDGENRHKRGCQIERTQRILKEIRKTKKRD